MLLHIRDEPCIKIDANRRGDYNEAMRIAITHAVAFVLLTLLVSQRLRAADEVWFETDVRPILKAHCFQCHGEEDEHEGKLDLRLVRTMQSGGDSGPAFVAGKPADSLLLQRINKDEMPPGKKKLSAGEKRKIEQWLALGARTRRPEPEKVALDENWTDEERSFWSFLPVQRSALPEVKQPELTKSPIDRFLLARQEPVGLSFSPVADRRTLIRRLSFDLLGLPPEPAAIAEFIADESPDASERLVDRLQASPRYGERWGRHWLDVAGYADSDGYTDKDPPRPWAFRYRDYVIRAFNADKPLDQFIVEQLAGDELVAQPFKNLTPQDAERLAATGFLRMAPDGTSDSAADQKVARNDVVAETLKIVSTSLLGMSVGCAQCHNHRYDPISQADYYRLRAVFEPAFDWSKGAAPPRLVNLWSQEEHEKFTVLDLDVKATETERLAEFDKIVDEIFEREVVKLTAEEQVLAREAKTLAAGKRSPEQKDLFKEHPSLNVSRGSAYLYDGKRVDEFNKRFEKRTADIKAKMPAPQFVACLTEAPGKAPPTHLFYRGDFNQPRQVVKPGDLSVFGERRAAIPEDDEQVATSGRRLAFARHLTSGQQPLVPRVLANRIWLHHFGRGLVATPGDFGVLGERPSHPELLDWLADELVTRGWSLKQLQRQLVLSTAYQQSSVRSEAIQQQDPENRLLARMSLRRLEAEAIRDAILAANGQLQATMYGPAAAVNPDEVGQVIIGKATRDGNGILVAKADNNPEQFRRSVYVQVRRSMPLGMLEPFDVASTAPNCELRSSSTVAPQALLMMNSDFVIRQAEQFAQRLMTESADATTQINRAFELTYGAAATPSELTAAAAFLAEQELHFARQPPPQKNQPALSPRAQALAVFCQALVSSNRFLYVD